jgi:hypothetical protein
VTAPPLMLSLSNVVTSEPVTIPVPTEPPPVGAAVAVVAKPMALNAFASELATDRLVPEVPVCSVIAPPVMVDLSAPPTVPVTVSIAVRMSWTVPVPRLMLAPVAEKLVAAPPLALKVIVWPLTARSHRSLTGPWRR